MAKAELKLAAMRDPVRAALAEAIADAANARRDLQAAQDSEEMARVRHWDAEAALDKLRNANTKPPEDFASDFIASVQAGSPCDVMTLDRPAAEARAAKEAEAANAVDIWKKTREACNAAVIAREEALTRANEAVADAAREVIRKSGAVERLMAGVEDLQTELINRRIELRYLLFKGCLAGPEEERVQNFLKNNSLPGGFGNAEYTAWDKREAHMAWKQAHDALLTRLIHRGFDFGLADVA